jgi:phosphotransacetylase
VRGIAIAKRQKEECGDDEHKYRDARLAPLPGDCGSYVDHDDSLRGTALIRILGRITQEFSAMVRSIEEVSGMDAENQRCTKYDALITRCEGLPPLRTAVVHPCDVHSLQGAIEAHAAELIDPVLIGPGTKIRRVAKENHIDISSLAILDMPHSHAAAARAVELVHAGEVAALMKGSLHTDELMAAVVCRSVGIRTIRRISHVFVMDVPTYPKLLFITDAAVNIAPTLDEKVDIVANAIELAQALGVARPKVAILSAVETVTAKIPSTIEAAALCKMAERGQIRGGMLDGPLAFDNAISREAAETKGIVSPVAGDADILLVPGMEAGNMLAKELSFLANAEAAGIVLGARVPIILTSRADSVRARLASCAVAAICGYARSVSTSDLSPRYGGNALEARHDALTVMWRNERGAIVSERSGPVLERPPRLSNRAMGSFNTPDTTITLPALLPTNPWAPFVGGISRHQGAH